jgi:DNA-binding CsgD family transcriptional regulator
LAKRHADRVLALANKLDMPHVRAAALDQQGFLAAADRDRSRAADLHHSRPLVDRADHLATVATVRAALGEDAFTAAWTQGAALTLDDAVAYATRSRGTRDRPATGWASLTPTEHRVVNLIVAGLSNPEIGARLFMSRSTVKTHLAHIYAKLAVTNRAELAALAARRLAADT